MQRRWGRRSVGVLAVLALVFGGTTAVTDPAVAATPGTPSTLLAGHQLVALTGADELASSTSAFQLRVVADLVEVDQTAPLNGPKGPDTVGTGLWFRDDPTGHYQSSTDHSRLVMQTDGNLVLRTAGGHPLWASNTSGTGSHNRLVMQNDGNLVIYTSANRAVWATKTTPILLPAGRTLPIGRAMVSRWGDQQGNPAYELIMQTSGDLQYRCGSKVLWHTRTAVRGSFATMQTDGNFVIYSPSKRPLWSSRTAGQGAYSWLDASNMWLFGSNLKVAWIAQVTTGC